MFFADDISVGGSLLGVLLLIVLILAIIWFIRRV